MSKNKKFILTILSLTILLSANFASAALPSLVPICAQGGELPGEPSPTSLDCILQVGVNVVQLILGLTGSLALVYFLYGGFVWLTSSGSPDKVRDGKDIVLSAVMGIVIVFGAFTLVQFLVKALGVGKEFTTAVPQLQNSGK